jgi:hypothetical protein
MGLLRILGVLGPAHLDRSLRRSSFPHLVSRKRPHLPIHGLCSLGRTPPPLPAHAAAQALPLSPILPIARRYAIIVNIWRAARAGDTKIPGYNLEF